MPVNFTTLCSTFEMHDDNLRLIHEKHAPLHSCRVPITRNDPWYNAMRSDIIAAKKHRHWAERQYLKYPTILNKQQFNKAKNSMVKIIQRAKSKFYLSSKRVCLPYATSHLSIDATKTLLSAFVLPKLDYCNSIFHGSPMYMLERLQKVQSSAARLICQFS